MNRHYIQRLLIGVGITVVAVVCLFVFSGIFSGLNRGVLDIEYRIRGESKIDSSIVILYLNNDDIASLGGFPIKRNYYALLLKALHDLGAKSVGVDISFTEPDREHPEYDNVLASVINESGNVVLTGYFRSVSPEEPTLNHRVPERFVYNIPQLPDMLRGKDLNLPFEDLLEHASGFGHTNISYDNTIPLFIQEGTNAVPSFSLELYRASKGYSRSAFRFGSDAITITGDPKTTIPFDDGGSVTLNFAGGLHSLNVIPAVSFLQSYDLMKTGEKSFTNEHIAGKIILLGIIAEGRSPFVASPFASQFPSIGLHAMALDNMIKGNFLRTSPLWLTYLISIVGGLLCVIVMNLRREIGGILVALMIIVVLIVLSIILFESASYIFPVTQPMFIVFFVTLVMFVVKHQAAKKEITALSEEKKKISDMLREKELSLQKLESKLESTKRAQAEDDNASLLKEIQKYKQEIISLRTQSEDLKPFAILDKKQKGVKEEFNGIVYNSAGPMAEVVKFIKKIAHSDATVLLLGESGTGKEVVARAIHSYSNRSANAFVAVNCGALTETLLESELFGHEKGAFTGAVKEKPGRFELANGGTIFMDEVAETSEAFQVKLLRILQEGTYERVGGTETRKADIRVIAATNRNIKQAVAEKHFREDLYYRLNVFTIQLPPLRDRVDDIPILAEHFVGLEQFGISISANVMKCLQEYQWKGNVRELQSALKRAVLLAVSEKRELLRTKDLPEEVAATADSFIDLEDRIIESLRDKKFSRNAISESADELGGLNRGTVAEYFRGFCFKIFAEATWNFPGAVESIAMSDDASVRERVEKKLSEYLKNAIETVDVTQPIEAVQATTKPKYKNLPQRYHPVLEQLIISYYRKEWSLPTTSSENQNTIA